MLALLLLLGMLLGDRAAVQPVAAKNRGERGEATPRIVGGVKVPQGKYPFMVNLEINGGALGELVCGASLIDPTHVLTAAHCTEYDPEDGSPVIQFGPEAFTALFGQVNLRQGAICQACHRGVIAVVDHPGWNHVSDQNDVAVLTLDAPVDASLATPIQLPPAGPGYDTPGRLVIVAGWGYQFAGQGQISNALREVQIGVVSEADCAADFPPDPDDPFFDPISMLCAGAPGRDSCQGDSGGPLFVPLSQTTEAKAEKKVKSDAEAEKKRKRRPPRPVPAVSAMQLGVVSWGPPCATPGLPGVYARLSDPGINAFVRDQLS